MKFIFETILSPSYWRYALFSWDAVKKIFGSLATIYLFLNILDTFHIYTKNHYSGYAIIPALIFSILYTLYTRRPIKGFDYKIPSRDYKISVQVGDLFSGNSDVIISTNTTFDTNISNGLISSESLQGQFSTKFFNGNTDEIDKQIVAELEGKTHNIRMDAPGNKTEYPIGTVARVRTHGRTFYFLAMSRLNAGGTASATVKDINESLEKLWIFIQNNGELKDISIPLLGTGRGRIGTSRQKIVQIIAQSFAEASRNKIFCNKLTIFVSKSDYKGFSINLYTLKDYIANSLEY